MGVLTHYEDGNLLEDVLMRVINTDPHEVPFLASLGKPKKIHQPLHQWPIDSLSTYQSNAAVEGAAYSYGTLTTPSRSVNVTQVLERTAFVSRTEIVSRGAGVNNMLEHQKDKQQIGYATDMERELILSSLVSGDTNVARRMAGALNYITTNNTTVNSGTKLTESLFNDIVQLVYDATGRRNLNVLLSSFLKRKVSNFYAKMTTNTDMASETSKLVIDHLITDHGEATVQISRVTPTAAAAHTMLMYDQEYINLCVLDAPHWRPDVAQDSHGVKAVMEGEITAEYLQEKTGAVVAGLHPSW